MFPVTVNEPVMVWLPENWFEPVVANEPVSVRGTKNSSSSAKLWYEVPSVTQPALVGLYAIAICILTIMSCVVPFTSWEPLG